MPVCRQHVSEASLAHDHEARAICERVVFVPVLKEEFACPLKAIAIDSLPSHARASIDLLPPLVRCAQSEAEAKKGERFVYDEIGGDECLARFESLVAGDG